METPRMIATNTLSDRTVELINNSTERVLLEVMSFECNGRMQRIAAALSEAAIRGVNTSVIYDRYSYFDVATKRGTEGYFDLRSSLKELSEQGVQLMKVGGLHPNPFARRHHAKAFIVDTYTLAGGGTNLTDDTFDHYDFMLEFYNPKIADTLYEALPRIAVERNDAIITIDEQSRFIIDGGKPGVSPNTRCCS